MNKFLILLTSLIFFACSNNPNSDKPVEFLGLPLQGNAYAFGDSLTAKGFEFGYEDEGSRLLYQGKYLNYDAGIFVVYYPESKEVSHIQVAYLGNHPDSEALIADFCEKYGDYKKKDKGKEGIGIVYTWRVNSGKVNIVLNGAADLLIVYCKDPD